MRKLILIILLLFLLSFNIYAETSESDQQYPLSQSTSANLRIYFVTPFKLPEGEIPSKTLSHSFDEYRYILGPSGQNADFNTFTRIINNIITQTGLCQDVQNNIVGRISGAVGGALNDRGIQIGQILRDCFDRHPDQASALANIIKFYLQWEDTQVKTILTYFANKAKSTKFADRLEAKLFFSCIKEHMGVDTYEILKICRDPAHWNFASLWPEIDSCMNENSNNSSTSNIFNNALQSTPFSNVVNSNGSHPPVDFDFRTFVEKCIAKDFIQDYDQNDGAKTALSLLLDTYIYVGSDGVQVTYKMFEASTKLIFESIRERILNILNSDWYNKLETEGCIPSIFAPSNIGSDEDKAKMFYSVCIPPKIVQKIAALPKADAKFFRGILATKIATLQTLELLYGSALISQEAYRFLVSVDDDLAKFAKINYDFIKTLAESYKASIDMAYTTTLEDVLSSIEELYAMYQREKVQLQESAKEAASELKRQRELVESGKDTPSQ